MTEPTDYNQQYENEEEAISPELLEYVKKLEDVRQLPEAPFSLNQHFYSPSGGDVLMTFRGWDETVVMGRLMQFSAYAASIGYTETPSHAPRPAQPPAQAQPPKSVPVQVGNVMLGTYTNAANTPNAPQYATQPQQPAPTGTGIEVFPVQQIALDNTQAGVPYLRIKCGPYMQHGIPCYQESIPAGLFDLSAMQPRVPVAIPPECTYCIVSKYNSGGKERMKIVGFSKTHN